MYVSRVACFPCIVSHGEYADVTDRQTDGRTDARRFPIDAACVITGQHDIRYTLAYKILNIQPVTLELLKLFNLHENINQELGTISRMLSN